MPIDPIIYEDISARAREKRFQDLMFDWKAKMVYIVVAMVLVIIKTNIRREPELPNRPFTKADVPLLKEKVKFLKSDAETAGGVFPHLRDKDELRSAEQAMEEVIYTPDVFPAAEQMHRVRNARIQEVDPALAAILQSRQKYEEARYAIANDPAITDKSAAIAALKNRTDPAVEGPKFSKSLAQIAAIDADFVGDPEVDQAQQAFQTASQTAILKRHPELSAFYQEFDSRDEAYHFFMAQANDLSRQITALENGTDPTRAHSAPISVPDTARGYGVVVGDIVDISAVTPPIALNHATLTAMDNDQLTVSDGSDAFTVRWENLIHLKRTSHGK